VGAIFFTVAGHHGGVHGYPTAFSESLYSRAGVLVLLAAVVQLLLGKSKAFAALIERFWSAGAPELGSGVPADLSARPSDQRVVRQPRVTGRSEPFSNMAVSPVPESELSCRYNDLVYGLNIW
ncbi:hypothetical protein ACWEN3_46785, partial [Streptomyces sp. NPDC004561]